MAKVHVSNVVVLNNPATFYSAFQFEITFECIEELNEDLEWKIIYVGSAESEAYDQTLDSVFVGPVPEGRHMFVFQADPPDISKIPVADAVGVTVVLLTCSYRGKEFVRVGYYVNNEYAEPELRENPPSAPIYDKLSRNILATQPRVTRFKIEWDEKQSGEAGSSGAAAEVESSLTGMDSDAEDGSQRTSDSSAMTSTSLMMNLNLSNGGAANYDTERPLGSGDTNSLLEPPGPLLSASLANTDSDSMNTPMEVI